MDAAWGDRSATLRLDLVRLDFKAHVVCSRQNYSLDAKIDFCISNLWDRAITDQPRKQSTQHVRLH